MLKIIMEGQEVRVPARVARAGGQDLEDWVEAKRQEIQSARPEEKEEIETDERS